MAQARFNKAHFGARTNVCIHCTPEIDFLRGEQGNITMGDFLDDTCLSILSSKMLKSLLDVGLYEAMAWARWGAVKWVQNQPRAVADNTYEPSALPDESISSHPCLSTSSRSVSAQPSIPKFRRHLWTQSSSTLSFW